MIGKQNPGDGFEGMQAANFGNRFAQGDAAMVVRQEWLTLVSFDGEEARPAWSMSAPIIGHGLRMVRKRTLRGYRISDGAQAHPTVQTST